MSLQLSIFDEPAPPLARSDDPATSHAAYQVARAAPWTIEEVRSVLTYDSESGCLEWLPRAGIRRRKAGCVDPKGHLIIQSRGQNYRAGRVCWALYHGEWPPVHLCVDHKDRNPLNNRIDNLRLATVAQNTRNQGLRANNKCGFKGVSWRDKRWHARLWIGHKSITLGKFSTPEEAHMAHVEASRERYGEFASTGTPNSEWRIRP